MVKVFDPLAAQAAVQEAVHESRSPAPRKKTARKPASAPSKKPIENAKPIQPGGAAEAALKADFRLFLVLLWRFLLGVDPAPAMLDMAYWLQHGPDRSVTMAFRGFSKSWITGAYALWRLYCNAQEKVLVVSGSLTRAVATTNWCLQIITTWPLLAHLAPLPHQRQSSKAFDVGPATPEQSPSFHALGIGGQIVGFRGDCIIPDDVETQQNSLTVTMREKIAEAVKEFDSVLKPGGVIKFLGTPHDEDSLYSKLQTRGYVLRVYPALYPSAEQQKGYGDRLAPWVMARIRKLGPACIGTSIMPTRFTDEDLSRRKLSLGNSEFALQFMLDTSLSDRQRYPLKVKDLMVASLDPRKGPENVVWSEDPKDRIPDLPLLGFDGDHYHSAIIPTGTGYAPYNRIVGFVDNSGRGADETALTILAELNGTIFWLYLWASKAGFEPETLAAIAAACVRFGVQRLRIEANFGDGMFAALLRPVLEKAWKRANAAARQRLGDAISHQAYIDTDGGTVVEEVRSSNQMAKERRILAAMEPVTQQHRLVVDRSVIQWDFESLAKMEGEDTRHRYSCFHQFTHITRDRDCLVHDDRLDSLAGAVLDFADVLGVDPSAMAQIARADRDDAEWERLFGDLDEDDGGLMVPGQSDKRADCLKPSTR
ncbi:hypothetical protein M2322_002702 [Rhodoblastus acidophilus]|uniref:phage terminase large subunit n=1 Tax=Rhodoblastus acidophilus TaxID=1074 RepID=UPI002224C916|nr:phage terminase large subunit [Rhodoblastus acidophilus]MCW2317148.1 hypothetical protein [Rhodoblastus acidophilus]